MAEYGYGYRSAFEKHTPLFKGTVTDIIPQLSAADAKPNMANAEVNRYRCITLYKFCMYCTIMNLFPAAVCKCNVNADSKKAEYRIPGRAQREQWLICFRFFH